VSNYAYSRWNVIYPDVYSRIIELENRYQDELQVLERRALDLVEVHTNSNTATATATAIELLTDYSNTCGNGLVKEWRDFFGQLFVKYRDGYVITPSDTNQACGCSVGNEAYSNQWLGRIVSDTGDRYLDPTSVGVGDVNGNSTDTNTKRTKHTPAHLLPIDKMTLKSFN